MENLTLVKSADFGSVKCDFYQDENEGPCMTIAQLSEVLGYASKSGIENIIQKNPYLKEPGFSGTHRLKATDGKRYETRVFTEDGIYEITFLAQDSDKAREFRQWVREILKGLRSGKIQMKIKSDSADPELLKARAMCGQILIDAAKTFQSVLSPESIQVLVAHGSEIVYGGPCFPKPKMPGQGYTAGQIGGMCGSSANMVGRLAKENGIKTEEYGTFILDKSPYSSKQVSSFLYNEAGKDKMIELVAKEKERMTKVSKKGKVETLELV